MADEAGAGTVLDAGRRLSQSIIWPLQRAFYAREGPQAWKPQGVPFWMTSNGFFARAFARVVLGFLRDLARGQDGAVLDRSAPLNIMELAAGSGQFAYLFLRRLLELKAAVPELEGLRLRYVMTDFTDSNLTAWQRHERLRPFVEEGSLDFALFDLERDRELPLVRAEETLSASSALANPLVVLANYAFDSTLQDCFSIEEGHLCEDLVSAVVPAGPVDLADPGLIDRIELHHEMRPVNGAYYDDPRLDHILEGYRGELGDTTFLFPIGALDCVRNLLHLSGQRLFLLCGDKSIVHTETLRHKGDPVMTRHPGCFSFLVNLHAIGRYFEEGGGLALHTSQPAPGFHVSAFLSGFAEGAVSGTCQSFREELDGFGPVEFLALARSTCEQKEKPALNVILALLKLSDWDSEVAFTCRDALVQHARTANAAQRLELGRALEKVWQSHYPLQKDLAFQLARISIALHQPREALRYGEESLRLFGGQAATFVILGYGHSLLGELERGRECVQQALAADPDCVPALELRAQLDRVPKG